MIVLGITGSIGMGKSTASRMLERMGIPVHDADRTVHRLLDRDGAVISEVARRFPEAVINGSIDRRRLGRAVFADVSELIALETILHPRVRAAAVRFLAVQARNRRRIVAIEVPLLFETDSDRLCDAVIVVTAPRFLQEMRVLSRPGMTRDRLERIRARQFGEREKVRRADVVVHTGRGKGHTFRCLLKGVRSVSRQANSVIRRRVPKRRMAAHARDHT